MEFVAQNRGPLVKECPHSAISGRKTPQGPFKLQLKTRHLDKSRQPSGRLCRHANAQKHNANKVTVSRCLPYFSWACSMEHLLLFTKHHQVVISLYVFSHKSNYWIVLRETWMHAQHFMKNHPATVETFYWNRKCGAWRKSQRIVYFVWTRRLSVWQSI